MGERAAAGAEVGIPEEAVRAARELDLAAREAAAAVPFGTDPGAFLAALERLVDDGEGVGGGPAVGTAAAGPGGPAAGAVVPGVAELARRFRAGEGTAVEATAAALEALGARGPALNALARLLPERAMAAAEAADRARAKGLEVGPLGGVPLAHKDMFHRAGELCEYGSTIFRGHRPADTATVLARLDAAGAVDVGRLNMVEFALGVTGHNAHTGHPRNPWDPARITGGSTSGGAAAVAAGLVPATLGSDTGGSIRVPAALCGLVGIKPTYGRVSRAGAMPLSFSLDHVGPLARSAEDCALVLRAIAGRDPADPTTSARPVPDYVAGLARGVAGVRVGQVVLDDGREGGVEPEIARICAEAVGAIKELGAAVAPVTLPDFAPLNTLRRILMLAEAAGIHRGLVAARGSEYNPQTTGRMAPGFALDASAYVQALMCRGPLLER